MAGISNEAKEDFIEKVNDEDLNCLHSLQQTRLSN